MNNQLYMHYEEDVLATGHVVQILLGFVKNDIPKLISMLELLDSDNEFVDCESIEDSLFFKVLDAFDIVEYGVSVRNCWLGTNGKEVLKMLKTL